MTSKCLNSDWPKCKREHSTSKKSSSSNPVRTTDLEAKSPSWKKPSRICMDQGKERALSMLNWIIWRLIMKSWFSFLRRPASIKTVRILKLWEELSTCLIKVSPIFAKHSTSSQTKLQQEEPQEKMVMPTNGFQLTLSRKLRKFKTPSIPKWRRLAFPKFCTSSTLSGEILWEKKTNSAGVNRQKVSCVLKENKLSFRTGCSNTTAKWL